MRAAFFSFAFNPRKLIACLSVLALSGCIVVKDFGESWEHGGSDPCVEEIVRHHFLEDAGIPYKIRTRARILKLGDARFLMLLDGTGTRSGTLYRYKVEEGQFITYRLNETKREEFLKSYPESGVVLTSETATIPELNANMLKLLAEISAKEEYWVETEQMIYNPASIQGCADS